MKRTKYVYLISVLYLTALLTNCGENQRNAPVQSLIYLAENGLTVKAKENVHLIVGKSYVLNEKIYLVVDSTMLYEMVANDDDITKVVTTYVKDMSDLFANAEYFNKDISSWDVSNVTDMKGMFAGATSFNKSLIHWDVSNVTDMKGMFAGATSFNKSLIHWDVSNVTDMSLMFHRATSFNQDITQWDVSKVLNMNQMFSGAEAFNQNLSDWNVDNLTQCLYFNQKTPLHTENNPNFVRCDIDPLNDDAIYRDENGITIKATKSAEIGAYYDLDGISYLVVDYDLLSEMVRKGEDITKVVTTKITTLNFLFYKKSSFNQDISTWDVSNVSSMRGIFSWAQSFNQNISAWDVSNVTDISLMFVGAEYFNQDISSWDVSNVTNMYETFYATTFNQDISSWDVSNVTNMHGMFIDALTFNQDLSSWEVKSVKKCYAFSAESPAWTLPKPNFTNCGE